MILCPKMPYLHHLGIKLFLKTVTLNHFSMPDDCKLRDHESHIAIHFLQFTTYEDPKTNFRDMDFHDSCQQNDE